MITPFDVTKVLTAAAPIVASVADLIKNKKETVVVEKETNQGSNVPRVNITIHNHFHLDSDNDIQNTVSKVQEQIVQGIKMIDTRYLI